MAKKTFRLQKIDFSHVAGGGVPINSTQQFRDAAFHLNAIADIET